MPIPKMTTERLAAYSDGIMAVVATLLVLGIAVPEDHQFSADGLIDFLGKIRHDVGAYALSFLIVSSLWVQHHVIFMFLRHANRVFSWLNFLFLFFVTLIPFATKLVSVYRHNVFVVLMYGLLQVACGLLLLVLWRYAILQHRLVLTGVDRQVDRSMTMRLLLSSVINLMGVAVSVASVPAAIALFLIAPLLNISHRQVDQGLREMRNE